MTDSFPYLKLTQQLRFKKPSPFLFLQEIGDLEFQDALDEVKKAQKPEASIRTHCKQVQKTPLFAPFIHKNEHFTKTGSEQT